MQQIRPKNRAILSGSALKSYPGSIYDHVKVREHLPKSQKRCILMHFVALAGGHFPAFTSIAWTIFSCKIFAVLLVPSGMPLNMMLKQYQLSSLACR